MNPDETFDPSKMSSEEILQWFNKKKSNEDKQKEELLKKLKAQGFKFGDGTPQSKRDWRTSENILTDLIVLVAALAL